MLNTQKPSRLSRSRCGSAALEFAIVAPVLILFVIGAFDLGKAAILYQQVYNAAHTIPLTASNIAVQPNLTTSLTVDQVQQALSVIYAEIPWLRSGIESGPRSVTMSSVTFVKAVSSCAPSPTVTCASTPNVAWSVAYQGAGFSSVGRTCSTLNQTTPGISLAGDLTSLPTSNIVNPGPLLVVDVHYRYTPMFFNFISGAIDLWASGYWPVRSAAPNTPLDQQYTKYDIANQAKGAGKCAGFP